MRGHMFIQRVLILAVLFWGVGILLCPSSLAQTKNGVILEVYTSGRGLVLEQPDKFLFCRIFADGRVEYHPRTGKGLKEKNDTLSSKNLVLIVQAIETFEAESKRSFYDQIEDLKDSEFIVEIVMSDKSKSRRVGIRNYMPSHPRAKDYYPASLVELLKEVQRIRPLTKFERKNNLTLELPPF